MSDDLDISDALTWEEGLPRPQWDLIQAWVESRGGPDEQRAAWAAAGRQWLEQLKQALAGGYQIAETDHSLVLAPDADSADALAWFAGKCRDRLRTALGGITQLAASGKQVVLAFPDADAYYRYVAPFTPEGEQGASGGMHIREGYFHVALHGKQPWMRENTLAHELTHAAFAHLRTPQWLEEGLAQMFEHDMTGRNLLEVDAEMAERHKRYWGKHGLDAFWRGEGFYRAGKVQQLSYQLAEILARLLSEDARPRWFGLVREPRRRFFLFLQEVSETDCGEAACREHLGFGLSDLAARFLGAGPWEPSL